MQSGDPPKSAQQSNGDDSAAKREVSVSKDNIKFMRTYIGSVVQGRKAADRFRVLVERTLKRNLNDYQ